MALARVKKRSENLTYGDSLRDKPSTWTSYPNASVGKDVEKSIGQVLKDGGVKGVSKNYQPSPKNKKNLGRTVTTKKGNKTFITDLIKISNKRYTK